MHLIILFDDGSVWLQIPIRTLVPAKVNTFKNIAKIIITTATIDDGEKKNDGQSDRMELHIVCTHTMYTWNRLRYKRQTQCSQHNNFKAF